MDRGLPKQGEAKTDRKSRKVALNARGHAQRAQRGVCIYFPRPARQHRRRFFSTFLMGCGSSSESRTDATPPPPPSAATADDEAIARALADDEAMARALAALCVVCESRAAEPGFELCKECYRAARRASSHAADRCTMCGTAAPNAGYQWCQSCYETHMRESQQQHQPWPWQQTAPQGIDRNSVGALLELLPLRRSKGDSDVLNQAVEGMSECTICQLEYEEGDEISTLPMCMHTYHTACISAWLKKQPTCPVCSRDVMEDLQALRDVYWPTA